MTKAQELLASALAHDNAGREAEAIPQYSEALRLGLEGDEERTAVLCMASSYRNLGQLTMAQATIEMARRKFSGPIVDAFSALVFLDTRQPQRAVRVLGLALCEYAGSELGVFKDALAEKFQALNR